MESAQQIGGITAPVRQEAVEQSASSRRLYMYDPHTGITFLIDTGAELSILPAGNNKYPPEALKLYAVNNAPINTYGIRHLTVSLKLRRAFPWTFCVAAVPDAIIGADFLAHYGLVVDLQQRKLIDPRTGIGKEGFLEKPSVHSVSTLNPTSKFAHILAEFPEVTGLEQSIPVVSRDVLHHITTRGPPIAERPRRLTADKLHAAKAEFARLVEAGVCRQSTSPWASPLHMVLKKNGKWRICGDNRRLNSVTIPNRHPIPHIHDFSTNLFGKTVFIKLDLQDAYNQIPVALEDVPKTAVITPFGLFEYLVMVPGLCNAGQTFQQYINLALSDLNFVFAFLDDLLIASTSLDEHKQHLRIVLERLKKFHLRLNVEKCQWAEPKLNFLDHAVSAEGISPTTEKVQVVADFSKPRNIIELRRFLGLANFYRRSLPHAASTQAPLHAYL